MRRSIQDAFRGAALLTLLTCFGCDLQGLSMDIVPGSDDNIIGVEDTNRRIPVALLGADTFSLAAIDTASLAFGPAGAGIAGEVKVEDVDFDGIADLVVRFRARDTGIERGATEACLLGNSIGGIPFRLCGAINATTSNNGKGGGAL
jgi:hypothetical protein